MPGIRHVAPHIQNFLHKISFQKVFWEGLTMLPWMVWNSIHRLDRHRLIVILLPLPPQYCDERQAPSWNPEGAVDEWLSSSIGSLETGLLTKPKPPYLGWLASELSGSTCLHSLPLCWGYRPAWSCLPGVFHGWGGNWTQILNLAQPSSHIPFSVFFEGRLHRRNCEGGETLQ